MVCESRPAGEARDSQTSTAKWGDTLVLKKLKWCKFLHHFSFLKI
jgi:hypothetical protein